MQIAFGDNDEEQSAKLVREVQFRSYESRRCYVAGCTQVL